MPAGPYSIALMASDAAAVLDAAGVPSAHVFGVSMGGMIAQEFALQYPGRVQSLILGCTAAGGPNAKRAEPAAIEMLKARSWMSREQAAEAAIPFIYDTATPRHLIDEDIAQASPLADQPGRLSCATAGHPRRGNRSAACPRSRLQRSSFTGRPTGWSRPATGN